MEALFDCVVCGSCTVDILARPVSLAEPIGQDRLLATEPIQLTTGGIVSNSGIALARLGLKTAALSYVGDDDWGAIIRRKYQSEGLETRHLQTVPGQPSSVTMVLVDADGHRSFLHSRGAPSRLDRHSLLSRLDLFARCRVLLIGYYSLMPQLEDQLPEIFQAIRETGCRVALDTAGDGGRMQPLDRILPQLDYYVPNLVEARGQTGLSDPRQILALYRRCGAAGILGVKLGAAGSLLSPRSGEYLEVPAVTPPGPIVDTTGAGDAYYAGLLAGTLKGLPLDQAARLAAAAGACCVTGLGATAGLRDYQSTRQVAGLALH